MIDLAVVNQVYGQKSNQIGVIFDLLTVLIFAIFFYDETSD